MAQVRFDLDHSGVDFDVPWEQDVEYRMNPRVVTELLREQVPVLDYVKWRVRAISPGCADSLLPLNPPSTNQHFTHQAALIVLAADYTGGTALASLLRGWPVIGVHPVTSIRSASLWLLRVEIKYMCPSVSDLLIQAEIPGDRHALIQRRFLSGKPVIETIPIRFVNGETPVAEASLTYFARQSARLRCSGVDPEKVNTLYALKLTSSAELIAGVRARESGRLFSDPYAAQMAGQHGLALAARFCQRSPQLADMVAARTVHLDRQLSEFLAAGGRDVVLLGVGWDMRPFRLSLPPGTRIFELDFSTTLTERRRRLHEMGLQVPAGVTRHEVPIDLRSVSLVEALQSYLDGQAPVFIAWEGMSMYFEEEEVEQILHGIAPLLGHTDSILWLDLVDRGAVMHPERYPKEVRDFMYGMQILGEPFTFGVESAEEFFSCRGYQCRHSIHSGVVLGKPADPVYSIYKFCLIRPALPVSPADIGMLADRSQLRIDLPVHEVESPRASISIPALPVVAPETDPVTES